MNILVASDLSARSDRALARSFRLAKELGGTVRVLHVVDGGLPHELKTHSIEWARHALARETETLAERTGVAATLDVREGHPASEIVKCAHAGGADLIAVGVHDRSSLAAKSFAETTAGRVLKAGRLPMLLVASEPAGPYRQATIGVDFSIFSRQAVRQAMRVAPSASVRLVHAYRIPFQGFLAGGDTAQEIAHRQRLEFDAFLQDEMDALQQRALRMGLAPGNVETILREGAPAEVLREVRAETDADLMVVGTHGRSDLSRAIWGSVAADILDNPPCDVLAVGPF